MSPEEVEKRIKRLRKDLEQHNYNYYSLSQPTISDFEFDRMMEDLQALALRERPDLRASRAPGAGSAGACLSFWAWPQP